MICKVKKSKNLYYNAKQYKKTNNNANKDI